MKARSPVAPVTLGQPRDSASGQSGRVPLVAEAVERPTSHRPAPLSVVLLVDPGTPEVVAVCRRAAAAARLLLKECELASLGIMLERCRPLVVVFTHEVYARDPVRLDTVVRDAGAKLVRLDSDDLDHAELEPRLAMGALEARRSRDTLVPPSGIRRDSGPPSGRR